MESIISNCELCSEHSLHVIGEADVQMLQCIHCGYVSSPKFIFDGALGDLEDHAEYKKLTDDMKSWSKITEGRIWIPTIITLPIGMLYPIDKDGKMKWAYAKMVEITADEREKYPDDKGGYYEKRIDTDNAVIYDEFFKGMLQVNMDLRTEADKMNKPLASRDTTRYERQEGNESKNIIDIKLPKLKKNK